MRLGRVCAALVAIAVAMILHAGPALAAGMSADGHYGPLLPKSASEIVATCGTGTENGSVPVSIAFDAQGNASGWTARREGGDLVARGPGDVAVFGVPIDCTHPKSIKGLVYFDVTPAGPDKARNRGSAPTQTKLVAFHVNVVPAPDPDGPALSTPVMTVGAGLVLACVGVLIALRRVRSMTHSRNTR